MSNSGAKRLNLWYTKKRCSLNGEGGSSVGSETGTRCTELFGIACRRLCCHPNSTLRCKPAGRPAALLISIDDMQNDNSLHLATGKWHRLYIGHSALFVLDPITARYYSLARTSNEPMTEHSDELITNRNCCAVCSTARYRRTFRAESCLTYLTTLFNCKG
jgi:hypothetical protein